MTTTTRTREWGGMILETRIEFGSAARRNRGRNSGIKVHRLASEYVVGLTAEPKPGTFAQTFKQTGLPVLFSCHPVCGCTSGQHAGRPMGGLTIDDVTCTKCNA